MRRASTAAWDYFFGPHLPLLAEAAYYLKDRASARKLS